MVRVISQDTFDSVVEENIKEFEMSPEEALEDAIKQFHAQDVDLSNIITSLRIEEGGSEHLVIQLLKHLQNALKQDCVDAHDICKDLSLLNVECNKDLAHKVLAGKNEAYQILVNILETFEANDNIVNLAMKTASSLMTGQPDLLDQKGIDLMLNILSKKDPVAQIQVLKWIRQCCLKHEKNRQEFVECGILFNLEAILKQEMSSSLAQHVCLVLRTLTYDDDIRVPFGKAHDHIKIIVFEHPGLKLLTGLLNKFQDDLETINEILPTLASLAARSEICEQMVEQGGLQFIMDIFVNYPDNERLNMQSLKLLKNLAGNDKIKAEVIKSGAASLIVASLNKHKASAKFLTVGFGALTALSLRMPSNCTEICEAGGIETIIQGMKIHPGNSDVQRHASAAIRNIVSRNPELVQEFLDLGIEELLRGALQQCPESESYVTPALRDLGCKVTLREIWTGKGVGLARN